MQVETEFTFRERDAEFARVKNSSQLSFPRFSREQILASLPKTKKRRNTKKKVRRRENSKQEEARKAKLVKFAFNTN
jgi:hypothetical protein